MAGLMTASCATSRCHPCALLPSGEEPVGACTPALHLHTLLCLCHLPDMMCSVLCMICMVPHVGAYCRRR